MDANQNDFAGVQQSPVEGGAHTAPPGDTARPGGGEVMGAASRPSRGKPKKSIYPLVKRPKPGQSPQIYFTSRLWLTVKGALTREYLNARERRGERRARMVANKPDGFYDSFLSAYMDHEAEASSMEYFEIGCAAYFKPEHRAEYRDLSPEDLKALGDKREREGYETEMKRLQVPAARAAA